MLKTKIKDQNQRKKHNTFTINKLFFKIRPYCIHND